VIAALLSVVSAITAVAAAVFATLARRDADRWRERALTAEHTLDRVLGRTRG
jgi:hypothetical protein